MRWARQQPLSDQIIINQHLILSQLREISRKVDIMSEQQAHLDTDVKSLADTLVQLETEIETLKSQPGAAALDFTAADALVVDAKAKADALAVAPPPSTAV